jgi:hypothetical protein
MSAKSFLACFLAALCVVVSPNTTAHENGDTITSSGVRCAADMGGCSSWTITHMYFNGTWVVIAFEEKRIPYPTNYEK